MSQTYENLEVILVDDGSPDRCGMMCDEFAARDSRIVVIHKKNGGLSDARNYGVRIARGEYLAFIDSDDYVSSIFIETLYLGLVKCDAEIAGVPSGREFRDGEACKLQEDIRAVAAATPLCARAYLERMLYQSVETGAPWRLYSRRLLGDNPFPVGLYYEDLASVYAIVSRTDKVAFINCRDLYAYRLRASSIMHKDFTPLKATSAIVVSTKLYDDIKAWYPELGKAAASRCFSVCRMVYAQTPYREQKYRKELWLILKNFRLIVLFDKCARKRERIAALITLLGSETFYCFCILCRKLGLMR